MSISMIWKPSFSLDAPDIRLWVSVGLLLLTIDDCIVLLVITEF